MRNAVTVVLLALTLACSKPAAAPTLTYEGSSTIGENIMPAATVAFDKKSGVKFTAVGLKGSGEGFAALMNGAVPIAGMSRNLTPEERAKGPYYRIIGYDAIAVFVNEANPVKALTKDQLKKIYTGEVTNWKSVGGKDLPIVVVTEMQSGTRATTHEFRRMALDGAAFGPVKEIDQPHDCVKHVAGDPGAIASVTLAFQMAGVRPVAVDGIAPDADKVRSGAYPLGRPLLLVSKDAPTGSSKDFFDFMLSSEGQALVAKKFTPVR
jgi:phosphate transport system substrate-binding protein